MCQLKFQKTNDVVPKGLTQMKYSRLKNFLCYYCMFFNLHFKQNEKYIKTPGKLLS